MGTPDPEPDGAGLEYFVDHVVQGLEAMIWTCSLAQCSCNGPHR